MITLKMKTCNTTLLEKLQKYHIKDENLQYDIIRKTAKISAKSSRKIDKSEYLTDKEILDSNQKQNNRTS